MRRIALAITLTCALAAAAAGTSSASTSIYYGVQDDAWLRYDDSGTNLTERVLALKQMGVQIVRYTLRWDEVARKKPTSGSNPKDPAYNWTAYDQIFGTLHAWKIPVVVTLYGTPKWANRG